MNTVADRRTPRISAVDVVLTVYDGKFADVLATVLGSYSVNNCIVIEHHEIKK